jgi:hypothetical protein
LRSALAWAALRTAARVRAGSIPGPTVLKFSAVRRGVIAFVSTTVRSGALERASVEMSAISAGPSVPPSN